MVPTTEQIYRDILKFAANQNHNFYIEDFFAAVKYDDIENKKSDYESIVNSFAVGKSERAERERSQMHVLYWECSANTEGRKKYQITPHGLEVNAELKELELAQKNAKEAKGYSLFAIGISIAALIVSGVLGYLQIKSPTSINDEQFQQINNGLKKINCELADEKFSVECAAAKAGIY